MKNSPDLQYKLVIDSILDTDFLTFIHKVGLLSNDQERFAGCFGEALASMKASPVPQLQYCIDRVGLFDHYFPTEYA